MEAKQAEAQAALEATQAEAEAAASIQLSEAQDKIGQQLEHVKQLETELLSYDMKRMVRAEHHPTLPDWLRRTSRK